ncbi:MAG: hypothetical protein K2Y14_01960 [Burkholderiales bacterium]|jgi:hypothetical protein|nr:hypothetical protein [Burkholderiales bacterium]
MQEISFCSAARELVVKNNKRHDFSKIGMTIYFSIVKFYVLVLQSMGVS